MKIGVRVHDFGKSDPKTLAKHASSVGFDGVQLVLNKAVEGETGLPGTLSKEKARAIHQAFADEGVEIFMMGAYFNPVHSNKDLVKTNIAKFKEHLKYLNDFEGHFVGSETGSFNDDKWTYNPLNRTEEAYQEVKRIFADLAGYAKEVNGNIALEGAFGHCMFEPKALKRLVDEIDNGHVFYTVDIYNYLAISNYESYKEIFEECLELFKGKIVIFHLKDFTIIDGALKQCAIGKGMMDYSYLLKRIKETNPNAYLIFEGSKPEDMEYSFDFVKNILKGE
ncbi:MAG: sugar phosphate isomerase/epimerase [Anaeroplasmataceae bacterium]|nr:sugar phosphate isomerase/epimerase [Anaeroplasmataceae bacterium]